MKSRTLTILVILFNLIYITYTNAQPVELEPIVVTAKHGAAHTFGYGINVTQIDQMTAKNAVQAMNTKEIPLAMRKEYIESPVNKFDRGLINTTTSWTEIPAGMANLSEKYSPLFGVPMGFFTGTAMALIRGADGIVDATTCVVPPYDKPRMNPEYPVEVKDGKIYLFRW